MLTRVAAFDKTRKEWEGGSQHSKGVGKKDVIQQQTVKV